MSASSSFSDRIHASPPLATRRERRKQEFRERILQAAIELFEQHGCDEPTLEDICTAADVSRPTFYKYYASKQELIQALGEILWLDLAEEMTQKLLQEFTSADDYVQAFIAMTRSEFAKYDKLERELIRQNMSGDPKDGNSISIMHGLTQLFVDVYQRGAASGELGGAFPVDFLAEMTMGAINTIMMNWAVDDEYPLDLRLQQLSSYIPSILRLS